MTLENPEKLRSIAVYTAAPWEMALVTVRITGPAEFAGIKVFRGKRDSEISIEAARQADLIVIQRDFPRFWDAYLEIINISRRENKPIIFEIDDLLFDLPADHSHRQEYIDALLPMLHAILNANLITVSTHELAAYMRHLNSNVYLVQNYLNDLVWHFKAGYDRTITSNVIKIGYMGGETHQYDLREISPALIRTLERYSGRVRLIIMGGRPPVDLLDHDAVDWIPLNQLDYRKFAEIFSLHEWDLFISPLRDDPFNRAKSNLKFLEYSTHGLPGIFSRLPPYENVVIENENGCLAGDLNEWEECLARLIEKPELRRQLGFEAQKVVRERWLLSQNYSRWLEAYQKALERSAGDKLNDPDSAIVSRILEQAERYCLMRDVEARKLYGELTEIHESQSWRVLKRLHRLREKFFPKTTKG